jgi:diguanylate cyclase (GGDEF)-like protein
MAVATRTPRVLATYLALCAATGVAFVVGHGWVPVAAVAVSSILAFLAVLLGVHRIASRDRVFALIVAAGLALLSVENGRRLVLGMGHATQGDSLTGLLIALVYLCLLGAGIVVVLRHAPADKGGTIDSALVGLAGAAPLWEFVLRPLMQATHVPAVQQAVALVEIFALLACLGSLGRITATTRRGRFSLVCLYVAQATALLGFVASAMTNESETGNRAEWVSLVWIVCYSSLGAAFLHPRSGYLTIPEGWRENTLTFRKLAWLGTVMTVVPLVSTAPQLRGEPSDGLLIAIGTLVAVPLVLLRIGQLIAQRAADQRALAQLAAYDDLTGLPNRRTVISLIDEALSDGGSWPVTVLYCDLDGFKPVNDTFGHQAGDEVLRIVGQRLRACARPQDVVGRLGGDEFVVLCRGLGPDDAGSLQQRIERAVADPIAFDAHRITVGITVGRASGGDGLVTDALIAEADQQMYAGKRSPRRNATDPISSVTGGVGGST